MELELRAHEPALHRLPGQENELQVVAAPRRELQRPDGGGERPEAPLALIEAEDVDQRFGIVRRAGREVARGGERAAAGDERRLERREHPRAPFTGGHERHANAPPAGEQPLGNLARLVLGGERELVEARRQWLAVRDEIERERRHRAIGHPRDGLYVLLAERADHEAGAVGDRAPVGDRCVLGRVVDLEPWPCRRVLLKVRREETIAQRLARVAEPP